MISFVTVYQRELHLAVSAPEMTKLSSGVVMYAAIGFHFILL